MKSGPWPAGLSTTATYWEWSETILPHISAAAIPVSSEESGQRRLMAPGTTLALLPQQAKGGQIVLLSPFASHFPPDS